MSTHVPASNPVAQAAADHPGIVRLARAGWLAKGIVYLLAGILALLVAVRSAGSGSDAGGGQEASPNGALKEVASHTGGTALLWLLAAGLFLYALWRLVSAFLPGPVDAKSGVKRAGYVVSAVIYGFLGATAVRLATSDDQASADGNSKVTDWTQRFMENTAGRWLVGLVGLVILGAAAYRIAKGLKTDVDDELDLSGLPPQRVRLLERLGALGEIGRGVALAVVGFFLLRAAITYDASEATGLDGALRRVVDEWWGVALAVLVGAGFLAYGLFCVVTFPRRRLEAPS